MPPRAPSFHVTRLTARAQLPLLAMALIAGLVAPPELTAQVARPLEAGDRVRVFSEGLRAPAVGTLVSVGDESLVLRTDGAGGRHLTLYLDRIERLERARPGNTEGAFLRGGLLGAGAALLGGLALSAAPSGGGANMAMAGAVIIGAPVGFLVGGLAGRAAAANDWEPVPIP